MWGIKGGWFITQVGLDQLAQFLAEFMIALKLRRKVELLSNKRMQRQHGTNSSARIPRILILVMVFLILTVFGQPMVSEAFDSERMR